MDTRKQGPEDSISVPQENEKILADEIEVASSVLLCIAGCLNGIEVTFLIDNGARKCFLSTTFAEKNKLRITKKKN